MSEQLSFHMQPETQSEVRVPSSDELKAGGFYLGSHETVAFDIKPNPMDAVRGYDIGNGIKINGRAVAEVIFGDELDVMQSSKHASGLVINTYDAPENPEYVLVVSSPSSSRKFSTKLVEGEMWGMGRGFEGQDMLPNTVSEDHFSIGIDEEKRLVIENHSPITSSTAVCRFGKG